LSTHVYKALKTIGLLHLTHILKTRPLHNHLLSQVKVEALALADKGFKPHMAVVQVGQNAASTVYVGKKKEACEAHGILFTHVHLPEDVTQETLLEEITALNNNPNVTGLIIQLPLPHHLNPESALDAIDANKDVDGLGPTNSGRASLGLDQKTIFPATPLGIMRILKWINFDLKGKDAVMVGRSNLVGRPTADMLSRREATVMICHKETKNLKSFTQKADLLIVATGVPHLIGKEHIQKGVVIIDVGISPNPQGEKTVIGDVDTAAVTDTAALVTPVPGGVGPMTVASLLTNVIDATRLQNNIKKIQWDIPTLPLDLAT
jgi:methylenetetrahydrofolate dehydrogenase (NADP+)/methenyltetrahydrofolate cyclohydrolase